MKHHKSGRKPGWHATRPLPMPECRVLAKSLIFMSGFAFGGRLWVNVADG
jgi:hypothetical protein